MTGCNSYMKGQEAEDEAVKYLAEKGYSILDRNYRIRGGEIDIVAENADDLVFVEVKSRNKPDFGLPEERVTPLKKKRLFACAKRYINEKGTGGKNIRFDVFTRCGNETAYYENVMFYE